MADFDDGQTGKRLLLGVLLVGGLGYLGYQYVYSPKAAELAELESRLETLQLQNRTAQALSAQDAEATVQQQLAEYRDQLELVEGLIPSAEEVPDLLDAISTEAQRTGVELALIQPSDVTAQAFYTRRRYDLAVLGSYHQIGAFLTRVGSLPRIITPIDLNLTVREQESRTGAPQLEARFAIETYVLPSTGTESDESDVG